MAITARAPRPQYNRNQGGTGLPPNPITNAANMVAMQQEIARRQRGAVDRQAGSPTGGPGKPLTLPHDWTGFDKTFAPEATGAVAARHPNIQSVNSGPTTATPATPGQLGNAPANLNSTVIQAALDRAAKPTGTITPTTTATPVKTSVGTGTAQTPTGGNTLTSIYGNGSSRPAFPGEAAPTAAQTAAATTANGVSRPGWQQQLLQAYPTLGDANHEDNKAFVAAHQAATAKGVPFDPLALGHQVMAQQNANALQNQNTDTANQRFADTTMANNAAAATAATRAQSAKESARTFASNTPLGNLEDAKSGVGDWLGNLPQRSANALAGGDAALGFKPPDSSIAPLLPDSRLATVQPGQGKATAAAMGLGRESSVSTLPSGVAKNTGTATGPVASPSAGVVDPPYKFPAPTAGSLGEQGQAGTPGVSGNSSAAGANLDAYYGRLHQIQAKRDISQGLSTAGVDQMTHGDTGIFPTNQIQAGRAQQKWGDALDDKYSAEEDAVRKAGPTGDWQSVPRGGTAPTPSTTGTVDDPALTALGLGSASPKLSPLASGFSQNIRQPDKPPYQSGGGYPFADPAPITPPPSSFAQQQGPPAPPSWMPQASSDVADAAHHAATGFYQGFLHGSTASNGGTPPDPTLPPRSQSTPTVPANSADQSQ